MATKIKEVKITEIVGLESENFKLTKNKGKVVIYELLFYGNMDEPIEMTTDEFAELKEMINKI